ncbi:RNA polymerase sigma factor [Shimia sp. FJ5]|uniref:RNA polymerase sigma factor n=1 Tax=Shimia sp. FJ5 TaxID=3079054 RepID=UPI00261D0B41|nr:RNA polymerase sigma factor [Shimia sp. FJ5]MDV4145651.1 RNA polymerase sigma factor [Shimia sp. FJ5]
MKCTKTREKEVDFAQLRTRLLRKSRRYGSEAEDLVQEAILKLFTHLAEGAEIDNLEAYATTTLHNLARSRWRKMVATEEFDEGMTVTEADASVHLEARETLAAIDALPYHQASLLRLVAKGTQSPYDIASRTGLPLGTVNSRLARARARLRDLTDS